jgi:hypothetical protein
MMAAARLRAKVVLVDDRLFSSAPKEHDVYSPRPLNFRAPLERNVLCRPNFIPLLTERPNAGRWRYKHFAPLEQSQQHEFLCKAVARR